MPFSVFRNIRRQFSSSTQFQKYLPYALGEIVLVVIGILIAIQINNYRNKNEKIKIEKELLIDLSENLNINKNQLQQQIRWDSLAIHSGELILNSIEKMDQANDSLNIHFHISRRVATPYLTSSAYTAIENTGFDIIRSKTLRKQIISLFDDIYPSMILEINNIDQNVLKSNMQNYMIDHFMIDGYPVPNDFEALKKDQQYKNILSFNIFIQHYFLTLRKQCLKQINVTLELIDRHIEKDNYLN